MQYRAGVPFKWFTSSAHCAGGGGKVSTPESKVKQKVTKALKEIGAYYFYPATGGYGKSGVPDVVACYRGRFFGIECKAGGNRPTALQEKNLSEISETGGFSIVVNEDNVDNLIPLMVAWVNEET